MDVITLSSDSESSLNAADVTIINSSTSYGADWCTENYNVDWNDDDNIRPAINYSLSPKNEVTFSENKIEEFITPIKPSQNIEPMDITVISDGETEPLKCSSKTGSLSSASESDTMSQSSTQNSGKRKLRPKLSQEEKEREKQMREQKKLEKEKLREEKKAEQQKQKALKAAFCENQRNLKPEENIKFLKVHIDNNIINSVFGGSIISLLQENNIQYEVESQIINYTVTWSKKKVQKVINAFNELIEDIKILEENILLYMLDWKKAVELIHKEGLLSHVETVKNVYINQKITVVIYGLKKYFNYMKNKRNKEMKALINDKKVKPKPGEKEFEQAPSITKDQLEFAITNLQIIGKHNCRLIETPEEFSALLLNITKSLSQIDYKLEKQKRQNNDFGWITIDSHPSVRVDKDGNGLLRLWQQQICQFSSVGLETAQAVVSQFSSPLALINQYEKSKNSKEGELLLQNIQIRRQAGILSTSRRIGPQLSKKIYKFFTSDDPDLQL